jgi:hypothetical protein
MTQTVICQHHETSDGGDIGAVVHAATTSSGARRWLNTVHHKNATANSSGAHLRLPQTGNATDVAMLTDEELSSSSAKLITVSLYLVLSPLVLTIKTIDTFIFESDLYSLFLLTVFLLALSTCLIPLLVFARFVLQLEAKYASRVCTTFFPVVMFLFRKNKNRTLQSFIKLAFVASLAANVGVSENLFGFDTLADVSIVNDPSLLTNFTPYCDINVQGVSGKTRAAGTGTLNLSLPCTNGSLWRISLPNVLCVLGCENLLCADDILSHPFITAASLKHDGGVGQLLLADARVVELQRFNKRFFLDAKVNESGKKQRAEKTPFPHVFASNTSNTDVDADLAHLLLCHASSQKMAAVKRHRLITNFSWNGMFKSDCYPCAIGKSHVNPVKPKKPDSDSLDEENPLSDSDEELADDGVGPSQIHSSKRSKPKRKRPAALAEKRGELVFTDIEGPIPVDSFDGNRWAVHFTDAYSRFSAVYFMKSKDEVATKLQQYIDEYYTPRGLSIETIQTDGDSCFVGKTRLLSRSSNKFRELANSLAIQLRHSSPYCHWENGLAERVIRTMMEKSFSIMAQRDIDSRHWEHCLRHVYMVNNFLPHSAFLDEETPYFRWFEKKPNGKLLQIFGSDVRVNTPLDVNPRKYIDPPGHIGVYIGFRFDSTEHLVWNYQKYQTRQEPVEKVGDAMCKFFRMFDPRLFLLTHDDLAYKKYLPDRPVSDSVPKKHRSPPKEGVRIAKQFKNKIYFGTATKNVGGKFPYDVHYDDHDFEHFSTKEFEYHTKLFRDTVMSPNKQIESTTFSIVTDFTRIKQILSHKIVTEHGVDYAAIECVVTSRGGDPSEPQWFQLGALIKTNNDAETREHNWTSIVNYLNDSETVLVDHACLFRLVSLHAASGRATRRTSRLAMLGAYVDPSASSTVTCILPDGTHFVYDDSELGVVTVHAQCCRVSRASLRVDPSRPVHVFGDSVPDVADTSAQSNGQPVDKNTYCPFSYPEILRDVNASLWMDAVENCIRELRLMKVGVWKKLKNRSSDTKPITSRFVMQTKLNHELQKILAFVRWTPRGFEQEPDTPEAEGHYDPEAIFAGTPSLAILRILMCKKAANRQFKSFHFDFKRAFSSTPLERKLDVLMPKGYVLLDEDGDELYLELDHSCEGLKQSGANWLEKITTYLKQYGFEQSVTEPKLFTMDLPKGRRCEFMLYIDDLLGICDDPRFIEKFYQDLNQFTTCKNQGEIVSTLGMELEHKNGSVSLNQTGQIKRLLHRHSMEDCVGRDIPIPPTFKLSEALEAKPLSLQDKQIFQSLVGSYLYIARNTRPDIGYATWLLACCMSEPTEPCLKAAFYLLRYLKTTKDYALTYSSIPNSDLNLTLQQNGVDVNFREPTGFCDANWSAPRSVSHTLVVWMNAALLWRVHRQATVALSTVESELSALSDQARDMEYLCKILKDLGITAGSLSVFCDNRGAIENAKHPILKDNLKHVALREFYVRDVLNRKTITVHKIPGTMNPADVGTKLLPSTSFVCYRDYLLNLKPFRLSR